jgi:hypothetical protein
LLIWSDNVVERSTDTMARPAYRQRTNPRTAVSHAIMIPPPDPTPLRLSLSLHSIRQHITGKSPYLPSEMAKSWPAIADNQTVDPGGEKLLREGRLGA